MPNDNEPVKPVPDQTVKTETVQTNVNPEALKIAEERQQLIAERKAFEQEREKQSAAKATSQTHDAFDYYDAFEDPAAYFTSRGISEEQLNDLVGAYLYKKHPDRKPQTWDSKVNDVKFKKLERELTKRDTKAAEEAKAKAEAEASEVYSKRIQAEFTAAADDFDKADEATIERTWWSRQFFDSKEEYLGALVNVASEVAAEKKTIPTMADVQAALEANFEKRMTRYKAKQKKEAEVNKDVSKQDDADTLTVKTPEGSRVDDNSPKARYDRALAAVRK